jgi:uncharacterized protein YcnI
MTKGFVLMGSRSRLGSRGILTILGAALVGVLGVVACPGARADVTITPSQAVQGAGTEVTFLVPDDRGKAYTTKVQVLLPAQAPIGEVDPMSVPGWAPVLTYHNVSQPVQGIHGGAITTIASAITWSRAGAPASAGAVNRLGISMGPLPRVDRLPFTVVQTYSDGIVRRWVAPSATTPTAGATKSGAGPVLTLTPAPAATNTNGAAGVTAGPSGMEGMAGMPGMEGMAGMNNQAGSTNASALPAEASDSIGPLRYLDLGLAAVVLIAALVGGVWVIARRRRPGGMLDSQA